MIKYQQRILPNGLTILVNRDHASKLAAISILYRVGARNENPEKTGFAHLFEHLMFRGTESVPDFDLPVQMACGENNAFANNDYTNFYITLPKENIATALWLESDRMRNLNISEEAYQAEKSVVIEEFKQRYINQPYGDELLLLRDLCYKVHPYRWPTIGLCIEHIEQATLESVMDFYHRHYTPSNAILSVVGGISFDEVVRLAEKWFGPLPKSAIAPSHLPQEPPQQRMRRKSVHRDVPAHMLVMAFHMGDRKSTEYHVCDLITDLLSAGQSSRLIRHLVHEERLFTSIDAYIQGSIDEGLLYIMGRLAEGITLEQAEQAVWTELEALKHTTIDPEELNKVRNRSESERTFNNINYLSRAVNMAQLELIGQDNDLADELARYCAVTTEDIRHTARKLFMKRNCSVLHYKATQNDILLH